MKWIQLGFLLSWIVFASNRLYSQEDTLHLELTPEHKVLPGTRLFVIPPDSTFELNETGMYSPHWKFGIRISQMDVPFKTALMQFMKQKENSLDEVYFDRKVVINGYRGIYFKTESKKDASFEKLDWENRNSDTKIHWSFILGNQQQSFLLLTSYPAAIDDAITSQVENTLTSFLYDPNALIDPFYILPYTVNLDSTPFVYDGKERQNITGFQLSDTIPGVQRDAATFTISTKSGVLQGGGIKNTLFNWLKSQGVQVDQKTANALVKGGLGGLEIQGTQITADKKKVMHYGAILAGEDRYYLFHGTSLIEFETYMNYFKKITSGFALKE